MKRFFCIILCVLTLAPALPLCSFASDGTVEIGSADELRSFSERCSLDTYSQNKTFCLTCDIDLSEGGFDCVPYFAGTFNGNGHTISGLSVTGDGSRMGLFRTVAEGATVCNLNVTGDINPGGTRYYVGGIAGENYGSILNCSFGGTVSGAWNVGGIVGINGETGAVTGCRADASVTGEHKAGGIAGESGGVLLNCRSACAVNTVTFKLSEEKSFDISSLSEEEFYDIADIGGIVGYSDGIVEGCENTGDVGYAHTAYNVGGIAGRTAGYVSGCVNRGNILGRKDAGGIAGQMEPSTEWDFSESKLKELGSEINELALLTDSTLADLNSGSTQLYSQLKLVGEYTEDAALELEAILQETSDSADRLSSAALDTLGRIQYALDNSPYKKAAELSAEIKKIISGEVGSSDGQLKILLSLLREAVGGENVLLDGELLDGLCAVISEVRLSRPDFTRLFNSFKGAAEAANGLEAIISAASADLSSDIKQVSDQASVVYETFFSTVRDIADVKTDYESDISAAAAYEKNDGAVSQCVNYASVGADTDVGGIVGSVSYEVSFDMEDELNLSDYLLTDARYLIFAVVRGCESYGDVTAKKECAGGVAGRTDFGTVTDSLGAGNITAENGDYCGGVVGEAKGSISLCSSRALLSGEKYVGGIAGLGGDLSDCRAFVCIGSGKEYIGSVAGSAGGNVMNNVFVENTLGGIDGVSFAGKAEPVSYETMLTYDGIPEVFKKITVAFVADGETVAEIEVPFGGAVESEKIPAVPNDGARYWKWDDFNNEHIYYSITVEGKYCSPRTSISSGEDIPLFLVEGSFYEGQTLTAAVYSPISESADFTDDDISAAYTLSVNEYEGGFTVRMRNDGGGALYVLTDDGAYREQQYEKDGSYIVFALQNGGSFVYVKKDKTPSAVWIIIAAALTVLTAAIAAVVVIAVKRRKKSSAKRSKA